MPGVLRLHPGAYGAKPTHERVQCHAGTELAEVCMSTVEREPMEQREQRPNLIGLCRVAIEEGDSQRGNAMRNYDYNLNGVVSKTIALG